MCEPTAPVEPNTTAVVVMLEGRLKWVVGRRSGPNIGAEIDALEKCGREPETKKSVGSALTKRRWAGGSRYPLNASKAAKPNISTARLARG